MRLPFIENQGQIPSESVKYYAKTFAGTIYVTDHDLTYHSIKKENDSADLLAIKEKFLGNSLQPKGTERSQTIVSYFKGQPEDWKSGISTFDDISLGTIWPNVDVNLKAYGNNVEKIFIVHPGGSASDIQVSFDGTSGLSLSSNNDLVVNTKLGPIVLSKPVAYQQIDGKRHDVLASYGISGPNTYGFSVMSYDPKYDLVIDPLIASTFIGGGNEDIGYSIALDSSGNTYITGSTLDGTPDFPTTAGAYDITQNTVGYDVFVSKFNSDLTSLSASTFIGGNNSDVAYDIAIDVSNNVYITGYTVDAVTDFPTTAGAYNQTHSGAFDVFVSKFNSTLTGLSASTLIGGSDNDYGYSLAIYNNSTNVYVTGETNDAAADFPTTAGAYDTSQNGSIDVFVSKFNSDLTSLLSSTFVGGSGSDAANGIAVDSLGNAYIVGNAAGAGTEYPTTAGAYDTSQNGATDVFVSKLNSTLGALSASTFVGGSLDEYGRGITLDSSGNIYITGQTTDGPTDFPTTGGAYDTTHNGLEDVFVSKFNSTLGALSASTLIGGSGNDVGQSIVVDSSGNIYITGYTVDAVTDFSTTVNAYDITHNGNQDVFVSKFNNALTTLSASTFIGGSDSDTGFGIALDSSGNIYITGKTNDAVTDFPTTAGAYNQTHSGNYDAFVSKFDSDLSTLIKTISSSLGILDHVTVSVATNVTSGGSVSKALPANGTLRVTLPTSNVVSITLPSTTSGTITVATTDAGSSGADVSFIGTLVNITPSGGASCADGCTISFTFTGADATAAGFAPSEVKIFHDSNEDGSFQSSEAISTTITGTDPYTATGSSSFTSKFAVGGIKALAVAGANALSHGFGWIEQNKCDSGGFGSGISLRVYEINYDKCVANRLNVLAYSTCGPISTELTTKNGVFALGMPADQPFMNDEEKKIILAAQIDPHLEAFNIVVKDKRDSFTDKIYLDQCNATKTYLHTTQYTSLQQEYLPSESQYAEESKPQIHRSSSSVDPEPTPSINSEPVGTNTSMRTNGVDPEPTVDPMPTTYDEGTHDNLIMVFFKNLFRLFH